MWLAEEKSGASLPFLFLMSLLHVHKRFHSVRAWLWSNRLRKSHRPNFSDHASTLNIAEPSKVSWVEANDPCSKRNDFWQTRTLLVTKCIATSSKKLRIYERSDALLLRS